MPFLRRLSQGYDLCYIQISGADARANKGNPTRAIRRLKSRPNSEHACPKSASRSTSVSL